MRILENHEIVAKKLKMKLEDFNRKFSCRVVQESVYLEKEAKYGLAFKVILREYETQKETKKLFLVFPEELGYRKKVRILIASKEAVVIDSRMTEGYSLFSLDVEIGSKGEWASKWLYVCNGALMITDLSTSPQLSQNFDFRKLKDKTLGFANWNRAFAQRKHITKAEYLRLKASGELWYTVSKRGNIEVTPITRKEKYEFVK